MLTQAHSQVANTSIYQMYSFFFLKKKKVNNETYIESEGPRKRDLTQSESIKNLTPNTRNKRKTSNTDTNYRSSLSRGQNQKIFLWRVWTRGATSKKTIQLFYNSSRFSKIIGGYVKNYKFSITQGVFSISFLGPHEKNFKKNNYNTTQRKTWLDSAHSEEDKLKFLKSNKISKEQIRPAKTMKLHWKNNLRQSLYQMEVSAGRTMFCRVKS